MIYKINTNIVLESCWLFGRYAHQFYQLCSIAEAYIKSNDDFHTHFDKVVIEKNNCGLPTTHWVCVDPETAPESLKDIRNQSLMQPNSIHLEYKYTFYIGLNLKI